jgi:hypothetical protein
VPVRHDFSSSDHPLPVFLSNRTEEYEEPKSSSWLRRISLFVMAVGVIGAAMTLSLGNPMNILGLADPSSAPSATDQSASSTASSDEPQASPQTSPQTASPQTALPQTAAVQTAVVLPARDDAAAAASSPQSDSQAANPPTGDLLKQFQSWAATQDSQPQPAQDTQRQAEPIRPIVQEAQPQAEPPRPVQQAATPEADDPPAPVRAAPKRHKPRPVQNARAEVRPAKPPQAAKPAQAAGRPTDRTARADARAPQDGRPQEQQPQPQTPGFLQSIGIRPQQ